MIYPLHKLPIGELLFSEPQGTILDIDKPLGFPSQLFCLQKVHTLFSLQDIQPELSDGVIN
jgi:hypothetical protein